MGWMLLTFPVAMKAREFSEISLFMFVCAVAIFTGFLGLNLHYMKVKNAPLIIPMISLGILGFLLFYSFGIVAIFTAEGLGAFGWLLISGFLSFFGGIPVYDGFRIIKKQKSNLKPLDKMSTEERKAFREQSAKEEKEALKSILNDEE
ncbi:MAG TPA: hypothetical protein PK513_03040 [Alphaproteobacteria bacterium]|nr:hypothetical protein [Alphaproteobacteria bacterium]